MLNMEHGSGQVEMDSQWESWLEQRPGGRRSMGGFGDAGS